MGTDLRLHFTIGIIVMLVCVFTTVFTTKEIPFIGNAFNYSHQVAASSETEKLFPEDKQGSVTLDSSEQ
jgi:hypothetical protein